MIFRCLCLVLALAAAVPAQAAGCLSDRDTRRAIAENGLITPRDVMDIAGSLGGELVSARLCEGPGGLVYRVAVIDPEGRVTRLVVDAMTGEVMR